MKAMTTGRWPPKKEEEMSMSPGAERAIMRIAETLPLLVKSVDELTKANESLSHPKCHHSVDLPMVVPMPFEDWKVAANALWWASMRKEEDRIRASKNKETQLAQDLMAEVSTLQRLAFNIARAIGIKDPG
jgi:hypothetical protein